MSFTRRISSRKSKFKQRIELGTQKDKRFDISVQISKAKKDKILSSKREEMEQRKYFQKSQLLYEEKIFADLQNLSSIIKDLENGDPYRQFKALGRVRRMLSLTLFKPPVAEIFQSQALSVILGFLKSNQKYYQFEAIGCIMYILRNGENLAPQLVHLGVIDDLCQIAMQRNNDNNFENAREALQALEIFAQQNIEIRDFLINKEVIPIVLDFVDRSKHYYLLSVIAALCQGNPTPKHQTIDSFLKLIPDLIALNIDTATQKILTSLCYLATGDYETRLKLEELPIVEQLRGFLSSDNFLIKTRALRYLSDMISENTQMTYELLNLGLIEVLQEILHSQVEEEEEFSSIILLKLTTIPKIQEENIIFELVICCLDSWFFNVKKNGLLAAQNLINFPNFLLRIIDLGSLKVLSGSLSEKDPQSISIIVQLILSILKISEELQNVDELKKFFDLFEEAQVFDQIQKILLSTNEEIKKICQEILDLLLKIEDFLGQNL
ncbi:importin subunit alpha [Anaeramoeba ignava]|uniref:Importin subunit alpha n=1 Tax=Anaeramoeba ignava TaxID=1746090 RepID=A0A9Q0R7J5_ANAIG|nr:importin subunit alpha [Anaeramoeba ignava]